MHGGAHRHFDGLQIQASVAPPLAEDHTQQLVYFARDFLADCFSRFFSSGESVSGSLERI